MMEDERPLLELSEIASLHTAAGPLYHSLGQVIRARIQSGEWQVGHRIPSERDLMQMFSVSRATVRQGVEYLVKEGVLQRRRGRGTFVAPPKIKQGLLRLRDFADTMIRSGLTPSTQWLGKESVIPPLNIQQALKLASSERVIWLQRLWLVNRQPMMIETLYLPANRFPDMSADFTMPDSIESFISNYYQVRIAAENEVFEPVILESGEAHLLGVKSGFPGLWVEVVAFDTAGRPVLVRNNLLRGDRCRFYIDLVLN
jgi:GntR family transcriptional regulator